MRHEINIAKRCVSKLTYSTRRWLFAIKQAAGFIVFRLPLLCTNKGSLKPLPNLQPMERRWLADILLINKTILN